MVRVIRGNQRRRTRPRSREKGVYSVPAGIDVVWNPNAYGMSGRYIDFTGPVLTGWRWVNPVTSPNYPPI